MNTLRDDDRPGPRYRMTEEQKRLGWHPDRGPTMRQLRILDRRRQREHDRYRADWNARLMLYLNQRMGEM